jgi:hypothetical protein
VLAVVQAHEQATVPQLHRQRPERPTDGLDEHAHRRRDGLGDVRSGRERPELDPPDAVRPLLDLVGSDLRGQA